jgi:hypothetical protein
MADLFQVTYNDLEKWALRVFYSSTRLDCHTGPEIRLFSLKSSQSHPCMCLNHFNTYLLGVDDFHEYHIQRNYRKNIYSGEYINS